jgi:serine/threonine protein kinase
MLPPELPAKDEQMLADAVWDSTHLTHDLVLRVADVVTGKGWITLIHEHTEGSLLEFLQRCAEQSKTPFPAKVAARIALDVVEGLEQSRDHCAAAGIPWRPGSVAPSSLLLSQDGRVRALDGQMTAAALRVPALRAQPGATAFAAPEMLDELRVPNERSDVFAVGVLLWELLTGRPLFDDKTTASQLSPKFKIPKVTHSVPAGTKVPQGLIHTVHTALELDPLKRQASLRELAVAIVMGVEDVATYEQVNEFVDAILEPLQAPTPDSATNQVFPVPDVASHDPLPMSEVSSLQQSDNPAVPAMEQPAVPQNSVNEEAAQADAPLSPHRGKLDTLPGPGTADPFEADTGQISAPAVNSLSVSPTIDIQSGPTSVPKAESPGGPFRLVNDDSYVPLTAQSMRKIAATRGVSSGRPQGDREGAESPHPAPAKSWDDSNDTNDRNLIPGLPKKRTFQLSTTTLILGFSTTVLAVIVIMLVMQHTSGTVTRQPPAVSGAASTESTPPVVTETPQAEVADTETAAAAPSKGSDAGIAAAPLAKVDHRKRAPRDMSKSGAKPAPAPEDPASGDSKSSGQQPPKHYVPNEL